MRQRGTTRKEKNGDPGSSPGMTKKKHTRMLYRQHGNNASRRIPDQVRNDGDGHTRMLYRQHSTMTATTSGMMEQTRSFTLGSGQPLANVPSRGRRGWRIKSAMTGDDKHTAVLYRQHGQDNYMVTPSYQEILKQVQDDKGEHTTILYRQRSTRTATTSGTIEQTRSFTLDSGHPLANVPSRGRRGWRIKPAMTGDDKHTAALYRQQGHQT